MYTVGGSELALSATDPGAGIDDDVFLAVWKRGADGAWQQVATGPAMPAYRMRWSALIDLEPLVRTDELVVVDAAGAFLRIDPSGAITALDVPALAITPPNSRDGVASIAATDEALLALTGPDSAAMWREGWPDWRTFRLPGDPGTTESVITMGQVRTDGDVFLVDVLAAGPTFVTWRLADPAD